MKSTRMILTGTLAVACLVFSAASYAQIGAGYFAPTDAMDTMNAGSVGGGGGNFNPVGRAQNAAGAASNPFGVQNPYGGGAAAPNPYGGPAGGAGNPFGPQPGGGAAGNANPYGTQAGGNPFGGGANPFGNQPGGAFGGAASVFQAPATLTAWGGERIVCARTGQVLQDARELSILATAKANYYDDGQNGNDAVANDNTWTNITINDTDYISPEAHFVKTKLIQTLQFVSPPPMDTNESESFEQGLATDLQGLVSRSDASLRKYLFQPREASSMDFFSNLTPMEFSQVRVATTEPLSPLPKMVDLQREQDTKLRQWGRMFLRDYRIDPDEFAGEFIPTFLPFPPRAPDAPLPSNFVPMTQAELEAQQEESGGGGRGGPGGGKGGDPGLYGEGGVTGEPIGNASSRYF